MERALSEFLIGQKEVEGKATVSLYQFDNQFDTVYSGIDVQEVGDVVLEPRASTALNDAIVRSITDTGAYLAAMPEDQRPAKVLFVVITDGQENASREDPTGERARALVKEHTDTYSWQFVYLGANQDAFAVGSNYGFASTVTYAATASSVGFTGATLGAATRAYRRKGSSSFTIQSDTTGGDADQTAGTNVTTP